MRAEDVRANTNLPFDLSMVVERTTRLADALAALPGRQDEMKAAIDDLSPKERDQVRRYVAQLIPQVQGVLDSFVWVERWMETYYEPPGRSQN